MVSFLRTTAGGGYSSAVVPPVFNFTTWTSVRLNDTTAVASYLSYPNLSLYSCQSRLIPIFGVDLEPLAPPVITYSNDVNENVTITAEPGTEIYYTITYNYEPAPEPTLIGILNGNSNIKKYTGPFYLRSAITTLGSLINCHINAIAVKYGYKCSLSTYEVIIPYQSDEILE